MFKKYKKKPLYEENASSIVNVDYGQDVIKIILPNREPFLFLDKIKGIDLENQLIIGSRKIDENDPVFIGHFPGMPVYPGVLQLEMISEVFCSLYYFVSNNTTEVNIPGPVHLRATRMSNALLQYGLFPGDEIDIVTKVIDNNGLTFQGIGQIIKGSKVCVLVSGEYYIV